MPDITFPKPLRYTAFISYRHSDNESGGRQWADWLHRALEHYEVPPDLRGSTNLRGETIPESLYPVFRDGEELPATADLSTSINEAIQISDHLVVLCSPRSAVSPWVRKEVRRFKELGRSSRILAAIIAGEPNATSPDEECFCEELRFGVDLGDGTVDWTAAADPLAADFRPAGTHEEGFISAEAYRDYLINRSNELKENLDLKVESYRQILNLGFLKMVAGILSVPLGHLTDRDAVYRAEIAHQELIRVKAEASRLRIFNRRLRIAAVVVLSLAVIAGWYWRSASIAGKLAELQRARAVTAQQRAERETAAAIEEKQRADRESRRAMDSQKHAEMEAARAIKALDAADAAASGLLDDLIAKTKNWPGIGTDFRTRILIRAQFVLLSSLTVSEGHKSKEIRRSLGIMWSEMASVKLDSGHAGLAEQAINSSEDIFRKLIREDPGNQLLLRDLLIVLRKKGEILTDLKKPRDAEAALLEGLQLTRRAKNEDVELAAIQNRLGKLSLENNNNNAAEEYFRKSNKTLQRVAMKDDSLEVSRNLAASYLNVAAALDGAAQGDEIERNLQEAERLYSAIIKRSPDGADDTELMNLKMSINAVRAEAWEKENRDTDAAKAYATAIQVGLDLSRALPESTVWPEKVAENADQLGLCLIRTSQLTKAAEAFQFSIAVWRRLIDKLGSDNDANLHLAWSLLQFSRATESKADAFEEARGILERLVAAKAISEQFASDFIGEFEKNIQKK
jgi:tetratricopeptide (TPR) repeat protein